ncbi:unnamed protein product [Brassicogethes aeneus]|uniref:Beta-hexosaminidase n=1 Tax=Brassicogethes aeneus TaxID=1431903 RepID=A0A9P0AZC5_BRAAE|nr:unnamed protein product [Brassicogethes aeneus]
MLKAIFVFFSCILCVICYIVNPGPMYPPTKGEIWPLVGNQVKSKTYFVLRPQFFEFNVVNYDCSIIQQAITRYWLIINQQALGNFKPIQKLQNDLYKKEKHPNFEGFLDALNVNLTGSCKGDELPYFNMDESYEIEISKQRVELKSPSIWGILRGMESFSQLIYASEDLTLKVNFTTISDRPKYSHRGLLLDTSRHFISVKKILETLDAMAYNKLNVFHWHIVDDQSFPYKSVKFPKMSDKGAYHPVLRVYQQDDIKNIIEYARIRGIRVMAEFDTPGHTRSWGEAITDLLTPCYDKTSSKPTGQFGPIDPTKNSTYAFLKTFFGEVVKVFPDKYVHLGGDEVGFECWESNPIIKEFMKANNLTDNYAGLESFYIQKLVKIVQNLKSNFIVWEEVFTNGVKLPPETIVHVWIDGDYKGLMSNITAEGKKIILSACYYLDHLETGGDWLSYYRCDPSNFTATDNQKSLVMGGEAAMWSEVVNDYNVISRVWPRASAVAEKLWSVHSPNLNIDDTDNNVINLYIKGKLTSDTIMVAKRLEEHTCRMNKRGIGAQPPTGPGVCL